MKPILKFDHVSKDYPNGVHALRDVSLEVAEGEFVSVIGPSGSGKSTLLRAVNQLIPVSGGTVWLDGEAVSGQHGKGLRRQRRKVGMIFQNYNLVYSLSVLQNVLHGRLGYMSGLKGVFGMYSQQDRQEALDLLGELGLKAFAYNRASDLSGGQKQRVGIARGRHAESQAVAVRRAHRFAGSLQRQDDYGVAARDVPETEHRLHCQPAPAGCGVEILHPGLSAVQG